MTGRGRNLQFALHFSFYLHLSVLILYWIIILAMHLFRFQQQTQTEHCRNEGSRVSNITCCNFSYYYQEVCPTAVSFQEVRSENKHSAVNGAIDNVYNEILSFSEVTN